MKKLKNFLLNWKEDVDKIIPKLGNSLQIDSKDLFEKESNISIKID